MERTIATEMIRVRYGDVIVLKHDTKAGMYDRQRWWNHYNPTQASRNRLLRLKAQGQPYIALDTAR